MDVEQEQALPVAGEEPPVEEVPVLAVRDTVIFPGAMLLLKDVKFVIYVFGAMSFLLALGALGDWGPAFLHRAYGLTNLQATSFFAWSWLIFQATGGFLGGVLGTSALAGPAASDPSLAMTAPSTTPH